MRRALDEFMIEGIKTTIPLHKRILNDPDFQKGHVATTFLERFFAS
jgi:acetyl-CoA carboxylase biotin carboxylase subunit